jgi:energy-coupling factor transporter transmembrane protein EcfT
MKTTASTALLVASTAASAHPGHGQTGWFHKHTDDLIDAAMIAIACLVAVVVIRLFWKALAR